MQQIFSLIDTYKFFLLILSLAIGGRLNGLEMSLDNIQFDNKIILFDIVLDSDQNASIYWVDLDPFGTFPDRQRADGHQLYDYRFGPSVIHIGALRGYGYRLKNPQSFSFRGTLVIPFVVDLSSYPDEYVNPLRKVDMSLRFKEACNCEAVEPQELYKHNYEHHIKTKIVEAELPVREK